MYQTYMEDAEFLIVYINEAHAADSKRPVGYATELGILEHADYGARCAVAGTLVKDKKLTIPCLIDGMDNKVGDAYRGHPDRLFLVRKDGLIGVAGDRGPRGFKPALESAGVWLKAFHDTGEEPALPKRKDDLGEDAEANQKGSEKPKEGGEEGGG